MKKLFYSISVIAVAALVLTSCSKKGSVTPVKKTQVITVSTFAGSGAQGFADGTGIAASFYSPSALVISPSGDLVVGDFGNNLIRKINLGTAAVTTYAGTVTPGLTNGPLAGAQFWGTANIVYDKNGNLFIADEENNVIREISTSGTVTTLAGSGVEGYQDGPAASAIFDHPEGIVADSKGNLFVAESNNNDIRKIVIATGAVSTYAGDGAGAFKDGAALSAEFHSPYGLAIDASDNIYVGDIVNNRVRKIDASTGMVSTFAGSGAQGLTNGAALSATFYFPCGLAFDSKGNLYVGEIRNYTIRKIATDGTVTTYAGNGAKGDVDGPAASASFYQPIGLRFDSNDNLYVADEYNNKIRKVTETEK